MTETAHAETAATPALNGESGALVVYTPAPLHALHPRRAEHGAGQRRKAKRRPRGRARSARARWTESLVEPPRRADGRLKTVYVAGFETIVATRRQLAQLMVRECLAARNHPGQAPRLVFSSNGQGVALAGADAEFAAAMGEADIIHADGMPIVYASRWLTPATSHLPERIATTDFFHDAALASGAAGLRHYFLGGDEAQNAGAFARAKQLYPGVEIVGRHHGYFSEAEDEDICKDIVARGTDVLWVAMGKPKQELWAVRNRSRLQGVGWIKTCGGLFGFLSGEVSRAPRWMQDGSLEWLYRALQEPHRLVPRYAATNAAAAWRILRHTGVRPDPRSRRPRAPRAQTA